MDIKIEKVLKEEPNYRLIRIILSVITIGILVWSSSVMDFSNTSSKGIEIIKSIIGGLLSPDFSLLGNFAKGGLWYLIFETICIAFVGTLIGALISRTIRKKLS